MSLVLKSTNNVLVESAVATNKSFKLGEPQQPRRVKNSQLSLLSKHKTVYSFVGNEEDLINLKQSVKNSKAKHRRLLKV